MSDLERDATEKDLSLEEDQTEEVSGGLTHRPIVREEAPPREQAPRRLEP
jgi:hypothetical protein